jgi:hypothetical protein
MIVPSRVASHVLGGEPREARMACIAFGTEANRGVCILINGPALAAWADWFGIAGEHYKAAGDQVNLGAVRAFYAELKKALAGGEVVS